MHFQTVAQGLISHGHGLALIFYRVRCFCGTSNYDVVGKLIVTTKRAKKVVIKSKWKKCSFLKSKSIEQNNFRWNDLGIRNVTTSAQHRRNNKYA